MRKKAEQTSVNIKTSFFYKKLKSDDVISNTILHNPI